MNIEIETIQNEDTQYQNEEIQYQREDIQYQNEEIQYQSEDTQYQNEEIQYMDNTMKIKLQMRKLWTDHAIFTRQFIVDLLDNLPSIDYTIDRLIKNQEQTGNCFRPFFGDVAADNIVFLLKEHITVAAELFKAILSGNITDATTLEDQWTANVENMSTCLCTINQYYSIDELLDMFKTHLILTKYQFIARMDKDYNADILYFDMGLNHLLRLSDCLTDGICEYFFE